MKFSLLAFLTILVSTQMAFAGNGVKGGDDLSPEFMNVVKSLPVVIQNIGWDQFPDIDKTRFQQAILDPLYKAEMKSDIKINGAPKAAQSSSDLKLTQFDPDFWVAYGMMPDGTVRKEVLGFHEILVVMKIEGNDDYHDSNKLYGNNFNSTTKLVANVGRIVPLAYDDPGIIAMVNYTDGTSTFYTCKDRSAIASCMSLGRPSHYYSQSDFISLHIQLLRQLQHWSKVRTTVTIGAPIGGALLGTLYKEERILTVSALAFLAGVGDVVENVPGPSKEKIGDGSTLAGHVEVLRQLVALTDPRLVSGEAVNVDYDVQNFQQLLQWTN